MKYSYRLFLAGSILLLLSFTATSCNKDDEEEDKEIVSTFQNDDSKEGQQSTNKKPEIVSIRIACKKNGTSVTSSVGVTATIQVKAPDDAPVTSVTVFCEGVTASARGSKGIYTASFTVPGKAYGTTYSVKVTATNIYGSYVSNTSFARP